LATLVEEIEKNEKNEQPFSIFPFPFSISFFFSSFLFFSFSCFVERPPIKQDKGRDFTHTRPGDRERQEQAVTERIHIDHGR